MKFPLKVREALPSRRWLVPSVVTVVAVGTAALVPAVANANDQPKLPALTAEQLLIKAQTAHNYGVVGQARTVANLGLPDIGGHSPLAPSAATYLSVLSGSQTVNVWADSDENLKLQVPTRSAETDIIKNANGVWVWDSQGQRASHTPLSSISSPTHGPLYGEAQSYSMMAPQTSAREFLGAIRPTTKVTVDSTAIVARHSAYQLRLTPKDDSTLVGSVRIAFDANTFAPLRVQVLAKDHKSVAFQTAYTSIKYTHPKASTFAFTPPRGASVTTHAANRVPVNNELKADAAQLSDTEPTVIGEGWDSIVVTAPVPSLAGSGGYTHGKSKSQSSRQLSTLRKNGEPVTGSFGRGRLLHTNIGNVVITDDGRVAFGSVNQDVLLKAIPKK